MRHILFTCALFLSSAVFAQYPTHEDSLSFNRLVKKLRPLSQKLAGFDWYSEDTSDDPEKRFDKLERTFYPSFEKLLANPLSFTFSFKGFGNVIVDKSPDGKLHIVNAGYATGGTSTYMGTNYIVYVLNDSVRVTKIGEDFNNIRSTGVTIYQLKASMVDTTLYLLLGEAKGNTSYGIWEAAVFGLSKDGLIAAYPAFPNRSNYMPIVMDCEYGDERFTFNPKRQLLTVNLKDCENAQSDIMDSLRLYNPKDNREDISDYGDGITKLKFNGKRFIVLRHPIHKDQN